MAIIPQPGHSTLTSNHLTYAAKLTTAALGQQTRPKWDRTSALAGWRCHERNDSADTLGECGGRWAVAVNSTRYYKGRSVHNGAMADFFLTSAAKDVRNRQTLPSVHWDAPCDVLVSRGARYSTNNPELDFWSLNNETQYGA